MPDVALLQHMVTEQMKFIAQLRAEISQLRAAIAQSPDAMRRLQNIYTVSSPEIRDRAATPVLTIPRLRRKNISILSERLNEIRKRQLEPKVKTIEYGPDPASS
jgi:hypothetical protein